MDLKPLNRGKRDNRYCGPAVISFITGMNTSDAAHLIRQRNGRRAVMGTFLSEVSAALSACGYSLIQRQGDPGKGRMTLAAWLRGSQENRTTGRVYLLDAGNHWQLVTGRRYACGRIGEIVSIKDKRVKRRARVAGVWEVVQSTRAAELTRDTEKAIETQREHKRFETRMKTTLKRRVMDKAAEHEIVVDVDDFGGGSFGIYFDVPEWLSELREDGEADFSTYAHDWEDAEERVDEIIDTMKEVRQVAA